MKKLKILIVDDDQAFAESIAEVFEMEGHEAQMVFSGEDSINVFREKDFDITFMDVKLPGMNGVESFLEIRKLKPHAKVVMMTAFSVKQLLEEAIENGALDVIHKPFDMESVLEMLNRVKPYGILIAEDDQGFRDSIREALECEGYTTFVAHDGREAVKRVCENGIDVLILDICMPLLNGLEVYLELKKSGHIVPTIIITGYAKDERGIIDKFHELSVTGVLTKPFNPKKLVQAVDDLVKP